MVMIARVLLLRVNVAAALESGTAEGVGNLAQFYWSRENEDDDAVSYDVIPVEEDNTAAVRTKSSPNIDILVTHQDTEKHGATPGCPACQHIVDNTGTPRGV